MHIVMRTTDECKLLGALHLSNTVINDVSVMQRNRIRFGPRKRNANIKTTCMFSLGLTLVTEWLHFPSSARSQLTIFLLNIRYPHHYHVLTCGQSQISLLYLIYRPKSLPSHRTRHVPCRFIFNKPISPAFFQLSITKFLTDSTL